jgi:hypothetical protein
MQATLEPVLGRNDAIVFNAVQHREAFNRLGVQNVRRFDSDWCSVFCLLGEERKEKKIEKKKRKQNCSEAFITGPEVKQAMFPVPGMIFVAVRYN